jgi:glucose/arabinose dehydrogenase
MRRVHSVVLALTMLVSVLVVGTATSVGAAPVLPAQFTDTLVAGVGQPTALAFLPDGRMLVTTQPGRLRVVSGGTLLPTPALDLSGRICSNSERGLLGVAADPDAASKAFYVYYTARGTSSTCPTGSANPAGAPTNRVSRFVIRDDNTVDPASETILLDGIYSNAGNHNAGDLQVGKDGHLYVSTGDGGCDYKGDSGCAGSNDAARDLNILNGKILRITRSGGIPADNPFVGAGTASCKTAPTSVGTTCREIFATGLRNPFRIAFDPNASATSFRINDVGQNVWEEIDQGVKGADYGWNVREGHCANTGSESNCGGAKPAQFTDPVHDYGHSSGCASITGGAYVPNGIWPSAYTGAYLFSDYVCGKIFALSPGGVRTDFVTGLGGSSAVHLAFGPYAGSQALYYTSYANGGEIRRIAYTGTVNRPPTAVLSANPTSGPAPLITTLNGSGSSDPDGNPLTYLWSFGDGSPDATTSTATIQHTYPAGSWTASLRVRDSVGATSAPATVTISSGNTAPTVTITSPSPTELFTVGASYTLRGTATDPQDGTLPDSSLSWTVIRRHDTHTHPYLGPLAGNNIPITGPNPEDLQAAANSDLQIQLTATDSAGLSTTVVQDFKPRKVNVTRRDVARWPASHGQRGSRDWTDDTHVVGGLRSAGHRAGPVRRFGTHVRLRQLVRRWSRDAHLRHSAEPGDVDREPVTARLAERLLRRSRLHRNAGRPARSVDRFRLGDRCSGRRHRRRHVLGAMDRAGVAAVLADLHLLHHVRRRGEAVGQRRAARGPVERPRAHDAQRHDRVVRRGQVRHRHGALRERRWSARSAAMVERVAARGGRAGRAAVPVLRGQLPAGGCSDTSRVRRGHRDGVRLSRRPVVRMERRQHRADPRSQRRQLARPAVRHPDAPTKTAEPERLLGARGAERDLPRPGSVGRPEQFGRHLPPER